MPEFSEPSFIPGVVQNKLFEFWKVYYPIVLAFLSFLYSVFLWFSGDQLENKLAGIFVGIWVPSILAFSIAIRQRRKDYYQTKN